MKNPVSKKVFFVFRGITEREYPPPPPESCQGSA